VVEIPLSFGIDNESYLLLRNGQCERIIPAGSALFFSKFLESNCFKRIVGKGYFIPSEIISYDMDSGLVIKHPEIPFVLYPFEWTASMLKDAALTWLDIVRDMEESGYALKDGHPWNIVFRSTNPIWVDFTSVTDSIRDGKLAGQRDFIEYFIKSLNMFSTDLAPFARLGLTQLFGPPLTWMNSVSMLDVRLIYALRRKDLSVLIMFWPFLIRMVSLKLSTLKKHNKLAVMESLRRIVLNMKVTPKSGEWSAYYKGKNELPQFNPFTSDIEQFFSITPKHDVVYKIIKEHRPASVLDIGCNTGIYSYMAESLGARVLSIDPDEKAADELYRAAKNRALNITVGCSDFVAPMRPAEYMHKPRLRALHLRARSEMVLCLAVVHHWVFKRHQLKFSDVSKILADVSEKMLVVEFVPPEDKHVMQWMNENYRWYSLGNFISELKKYFSHVEVHESFPSPRVLVFCEK
jgi:SAM-dependent methyltransferase